MALWRMRKPSPEHVRAELDEFRARARRTEIGLQPEHADPVDLRPGHSGECDRVPFADFARFLPRPNSFHQNGESPLARAAAGGNIRIRRLAEHDFKMG